ncbi:hypothetical protein [Bacillus cereus]|uniref:hypothetical protein n=1 Tax=Bacillus cereus TaxID=1396 RepID=UPI000BEE4D8D|nr:hypothetical protein [Bacillus cereus]PEA06300.1 hypothetical protein CON37_02145 [Bacillus cereus]
MGGVAIMFVTFMLCGTFSISFLIWCAMKCSATIFGFMMILFQRERVKSVGEKSAGVDMFIRSYLKNGEYHVFIVMLVFVLRTCLEGPGANLE